MISKFRRTLIFLFGPPSRFCQQLSMMQHNSLPQTQGGISHVLQREGVSSLPLRRFRNGREHGRHKLCGNHALCRVWQPEIPKMELSNDSWLNGNNLGKLCSISNPNSPTQICCPSPKVFLTKPTTFHKWWIWRFLYRCKVVLPRFWWIY